MGAKERYFRPGQAIFKEGQPSESMLLIQKGTVAIRKMKGTAFVDIARVHPNEVIGELSFFDRQPRSATAVALTEVEVLEIDFKSLDKIYGQIPPYFKTILSCVADRLRKANDTIRRLQKNVVRETEGVVGQAPQEDEDTADTKAMLNAVTGASPATQESSDLEKEFQDLSREDESKE